MDIGLYHPMLKSKGGAEKVVLEIAKRIDNVKIYTLYIDREATFEGFEEVEVEVLGSNKKPRGFIDKGLRFGIGSIFTKIPEKELDLLIVSEAGLGSLITLRNNEVPIICYCHTPLRPALPEFKQTYLSEISLAMKPVYSIGLNVYNSLEKRAWEKFDLVLSNSQTTKDRILDKGLAETVEVLNPGADLDKETKDEAEKYFFYPSRFRRYKRQDLAIEAFKQADLEEFNLILAGSGQEKHYIEELEDMSTENIEIETDVPGERWEELYSKSYAVLFLAEKEDWGIIPIEAGAYSKPTIAVNEGGPTESVIDGETGLLVRPDPEEIAEKMKLLAENPEKAEEMGKKAHENVQKYSWKNFASRLQEEITQLI